MVEQPEYSRTFNWYLQLVEILQLRAILHRLKIKLLALGHLQLVYNEIFEC